MVFKEDLQFRRGLESLALEIKEKKINISNEQETKQHLIIPFIKLLGYDTFNPLEFKLEFTADFGMKKGEKVDYAILKDNKPIIFIEAKPVNEILDKVDAQLSRYFNAFSETRFSIITNGEEYRFFSDTQKQNVMDKTPFLTVNFSNLKESDFQNLVQFKKENYNEENLCNIAQELHDITTINTLLKNLIKNPTDDFIKFLIRAAMPEKTITTKFLERMNPIVKKAISTSILESTEVRIKDQQKDSQKIPTVKDGKKEKPIGSPIPETKSIQPDLIKSTELTDEELKSFETVKTILKKAGRDISNLTSKDTIYYFSINNGLTTKWFLRLYLSENKKSINVRINTPNIELLTKGFQIKEYPGSGVTDIRINSIEDLKKLDTLIIACFDEVNKG